MAAILNFRENLKFLVSPKPCEISAKFLAHRVYMQDTLLNSQKFFLFPKMAHRVYLQDTLLNSHKFFLFPKMAAILNFRIFDQNGKT